MAKKEMLDYQDCQEFGGILVTKVLLAYLAEMVPKGHWVKQVIGDFLEQRAVKEMQEILGLQGLLDNLDSLEEMD